MNEEKKKLYKWQIDTVQNEGKNVTKREEGFLQDMENWIDEDRELNEEQEKELERIYRERAPN